MILNILVNFSSITALSLRCNGSKTQKPVKTSTMTKMYLLLLFVPSFGPDKSICKRSHGAVTSGLWLVRYLYFPMSLKAIQLWQVCVICNAIPCIPFQKNPWSTMRRTILSTPSWQMAWHVVNNSHWLLIDGIMYGVL